MKRSPSVVLLSSAVLVLAGACKPAQTPAGEGHAPSTPAASATAAAPDSAPQTTAPDNTAPDNAAPDNAAPGDAPFPQLQIATLDGPRFDLNQHRGKWVVVNFWATWCKPCVKEMPDLSALDTMREHIQVLGLAYDDSDPKDIRAFLAQHPVSYPIAIVDTFQPPASFATPRGLPTTYLIAPDGRLTKKFMGPVSAKDIETAIAAAGGPGA